MNGTLFRLGDVPLSAAMVMIAFGATALLLLFAIALIIARSSRETAATAIAQAIRADELEERTSDLLRAQHDGVLPG